MKDEEEIKSNSDRVFMELYGRNEYRLVFNSVKEIDFATYTIQAKNKLGSDIKKIEFSGIIYFLLGSNKKMMIMIYAQEYQMIRF
jgi:hypothetical protein